MQRSILLFAGLRQAIGSNEVSVDVAPATTAGELKTLLAARFPAIAGSLPACRVAVNLEFVDDDQDIGHATELALIPPVSGGIDLHESGSHSSLHQDALSIDAALARVSHRGAGGINLFIGQVRENSRNKTVTHLSYEAYPAMALHVMDTIAKNIEQEIEGAKVAISHRLGTLQVGEVAVVVAASAPHRAESFDACRKAIEALKELVPIWKKEFADDGGVWIGQGP